MVDGSIERLFDCPFARYMSDLSYQNADACITI